MLLFFLKLDFDIIVFLQKTSTEKFNLTKIDKQTHIHLSSKHICKEKPLNPTTTGNNRRLQRAVYKFAKVGKRENRNAYPWSGYRWNLHRLYL